MLRQEVANGDHLTMRGRILFGSARVVARSPKHTIFRDNGAEWVVALARLIEGQLHEGLIFRARCGLGWAWVAQPATAGANKAAADTPVIIVRRDVSTNGSALWSGRT